MQTADEPASDVAPSRSWFLAGVRAACSIPLLILLSAFVGFAGLARETGISLPEALFMTFTIWALPSMVVLVGAIQTGSALPAAALAVTLSAVRLMPMVVALMPEMRTPRTRSWVPYALSHFVAVTSWVMAFDRFPGVPREARTSFYAGIAVLLMAANLVAVAVTYTLAGELPPAVSAALLFLTPMYFLTSLWGSARERAGRYAMPLGLVLGPGFHALLPQGDLLAAGVVGGGLAYGLHRLLGREGAR